MHPTTGDPHTPPAQTSLQQSLSSAHGKPSEVQTTLPDAPTDAALDVARRGA